MNKDELYILIKLLQKGYGIKDSIELIKPIDQEWLMHYERGEQIWEFMNFELSKMGKRLFHFNIQIFTLDQALQHSLEYEKLKERFVNKWSKQLLYPCFLLFSSLGLFFVFTRYVYPMFETMNVHLPTSNLLLLNLIQGNVILLMIVLSVLVVILIIRPSKLMDKIIRFPIMQSIISYQLAFFLSLLSAQGCSSWQMLELLSHLEGSTLFQHLVSHIKEQLNQGNELTQILISHPYLSSSFKRFYKMGTISFELELFLKNYLDFQEIKWQQWLKKAVMLIQFCSYGLIAFVIVLMYQMMLLPLEMMNQI